MMSIGYYTAFFFASLVAAGSGAVEHDDRKQHQLRLLRNRQLQGPPDGAGGSRGREVALAHVRNNAVALGLRDDDVANMRVTDQVRTAHNGVTSVYLRQTYLGLDVVNGNMNVNVLDAGSSDNDAVVVGKVGNSFVRDIAGKGPPAQPSVSFDEAIALACEQLAAEAAEDEVLLNDNSSRRHHRLLRQRQLQQDCSMDDIIPTLDLVYYSVEGVGPRLAWEMVIRTLDQRHWYNLWIDAETGVSDRNEVS